MTTLTASSIGLWGTGACGGDQESVTQHRESRLPYKGVTTPL